jgi:hypothetical protein
MRLSHSEHSHGASGISVQPAYSTADRLYFPNAEYPRGFVGGNALKLHFFFPHFEHRILLATSSSRASQPQSLPNVCDSAVRSCLHAEHLSTNVYWPNSSLSLFIRNSRAMARIVTSQNRSVHPVLEQRRHCIENREGQTDGTESYSSRHIPALNEMNSRQTAPAPRGRRPPPPHLRYNSLN